MPIVKTIDTAYKLEQAFKDAERGNNFSYKGLQVLFEYLDEMGDSIELDVIALCCEYNESSIEEIIDDYSIDVSDADGDERVIKNIVEEYLNENTCVCGQTSNGFVYAAF